MAESESGSGKSSKLQFGQISDLFTTITQGISFSWILFKISESSFVTPKEASITSTAISVLFKI